LSFSDVHVWLWSGLSQCVFNLHRITRLECWAETWEFRKILIIFLVDLYVLLSSWSSDA
jgi:hypothetical protein